MYGFLELYINLINYDESGIAQERLNNAIDIIVNEKI